MSDPAQYARELYARARALSVALVRQTRLDDAVLDDARAAFTAPEACRFDPARLETTRAWFDAQLAAADPAGAVPLAPPRAAPRPAPASPTLRA